MEDYLWILIIIGIAVTWGIISWIIETISNSKKYLELKPKLDNLENSIRKHEIKIKKNTAELELSGKQKTVEHESKVEKDREEWRLRAKQWNKKIQQDQEEILKIAKQKSMGFPWLAEAYAEYYSLKDLKKEKYLENKNILRLLQQQLFVI